MTEQPARHTVDTITSDALDQLYARIDTLEHVAAGNKRHVQLIVPDLEAALARAEQAEEQLATVALIFEGFGRLLATSSRDWGAYRVDAWLWAVVLGWDCEEPCLDDECQHDTLEQCAREFGWDDAAVAKARRYRAAVRALDELREAHVLAVHIGNHANAEDCPGCSGTNPPWPFICPGETS